MSTMMPLGMLVFGPLADRVSIEILLIVSGVLMAIPGAWVFFTRNPTPTESEPGPAELEMQAGDCG
jgi:hypothetical protein